MSKQNNSGPVYQQVVFGDEAHEKLLEGATILANAVRSTMGPSGQSVIIDTNAGPPLITKDGVTVAKSINLKQKLPKMGAELLKEVASKTNEIAGDGPQPLYAKVLTPHGWKNMSDLKLGDEICGTNGSIQKVLGIFPKGQKEIFKVSLTDGNKKTRTVECSEDHLWSIKTYYGSSHTMTTKDLLQSGLKRSSQGGKYFISPTCVEFANNINQLPLDPYLLGVLLGDGSLSEKHDIEITVGLNQDYILDKLILPKNCTLRKRNYPQKHYIKASICGSIRKNTGRYERKSIIKNILKDLELLGTNSHTKFIPKQYLYSSVDNRMKLLEGLIDTDPGRSPRRGVRTPCRRRGCR